VFKWFSSISAFVLILMHINLTNAQRSLDPYPRTQLSLHTATITTLSFSHVGHLARNEPALNDNTAHQHHTTAYSSTFASVGKLTTTAPSPCCLVVNLAWPEVTLAKSCGQS
jgi:hypothetical protein